MTLFSGLATIIVVTVLNILLGMLWYSPVLFGNEWAKAYKLDPTRLKPTPLHYLGSILVSFVTALIICVLVRNFHLTTWLQGFQLGVLLWLGLIVTTHFSGVIWAGKPLKVYFIDIAYQFVSILMMSSILAAWH